MNDNPTVIELNDPTLALAWGLVAHADSPEMVRDVFTTCDVQELFQVVTRLVALTRLALEAPADDGAALAELVVQLDHALTGPKESEQ